MDREALFQITYGLYVLGVKKESGYGGCIINTVVQTTDEPLTITVTVNKSNETCDSITNSGEFLISVLAQDADPFVISNFGFQSGRTVDKWANISHDMKNGLPCIENSAAYFHCKVLSVTALETHKMFICQVLDAWKGQKTPITYSYYQEHVKEKAKDAFQRYKGEDTNAAAKEDKKVKWVCKICGYVYEGEKPFEELPENWTCPWCSHPKSDFIRQEG